jgi:RNA polymerase sigma-70 factor, ECF subfamily
MDQDDGALMSEVREGRTEVLAILFQRHHRRLFHFFLGLTGQRQRSEDLAQEVFLRVLRYRRSFKQDAPFLPWMFRIARRLHLDHREIAVVEFREDEFLERVPDCQDSPQRCLERRSNEILLSRALLRLDPRKRQLLLFSRNPELGYREIAEMMECSVESVKVQVHRALKELRAAFQALEGGAR